MVCLYALLVLPKERVWDKYPDNYKRVNDWKEANMSDCADSCTYMEEGINSEKFKHIGHLRNAVSHGNVDFDDTNPRQVICMLKDAVKDGAARYTLKLTTGVVGELVIELVKAQQQYVGNIIKRQQEAGTEN